MKKSVFIFLSTVVLLLGLVSFTSASPMEQIIKVNCNQAQSTLSRIEKTDSALRINRGRAYNEITDLFYAMNARLASNKISAPNLASILDDYEKKLEDFRNNYNKYDDSLSDILNYKCQEKPFEFYTKLEKLRIKRHKLGEVVSDLDNLFSDYKKEFMSIKSQLKVEHE